MGRTERLGLSFQFRYRPSETILKQIESLDRIGYLLQLVVSLGLKVRPSEIGRNSLLCHTYHLPLRIHSGKDESKTLLVTRTQRCVPLPRRLTWKYERLPNGEGSSQARLQNTLKETLHRTVPILNRSCRFATSSSSEKRQFEVYFLTSRFE